jgi:hypothetical protein
MACSKICLLSESPQASPRRATSRPYGYFPLLFAYTLCMSRYTKANHRILMQFVRRDVWYVTFLEPGLEIPLPKMLTFKDEARSGNWRAAEKPGRPPRIVRCWTTQ